MSRALPAIADRYKTTAVKTCSPAELVLLLYDGFLRFAAEADQAIGAKDRARAGERIGRCHAILEELVAGLDAEKAPELCANLEGLYRFAMARLLRANLEQSREALAEAVVAIRPVREGWAQMLGR